MVYIHALSVRIFLRSFDRRSKMMSLKFSNKPPYTSDVDASNNVAWTRFARPEVDNK